MLRGGADVLTGRAGQDLIAGDVYRMNGGTMTGGNDRIQGGEDSDIISGDVLNSIGLQFVTSIPRAHRPVVHHHQHDGRRRHSLRRQRQ